MLKHTKQEFTQTGIAPTITDLERIVQGSNMPEDAKLLSLVRLTPTDVREPQTWTITFSWDEDVA